VASGSGPSRRFPRLGHFRSGRERTLVSRSGSVSGKHGWGGPADEAGRALSRGQATARPSPQAVSARPGHDRSAKNIGERYGAPASIAQTIRTGATILPACYRQRAITRVSVLALYLSRSSQAWPIAVVCSLCWKAGALESLAYLYSIQVAAKCPQLFACS
jgi:hypothetical protein